jgi:alkyl hydroperoxide reductase subunit F
MIRRAGTDIGVRFAGLPMGHEFTSLVLALLQVGGHPPRAQELIEQVKALDGDSAFETYFSQSCQNCPDVVQALNLMACSTRASATSPSTAPVPGRGRGSAR